MGETRSGGAPEGGVDLSQRALPLQAPLGQILAHRSPDKKFFGRRKGRKLTVKQASSLTGALKKAALKLGDAVESANDLLKIFDTDVDQVWLEIGFGAGEHLLWQAETNTRTGFIGAEPFVNGVASLLAALEGKGLSDRIRIHADDVLRVLEWLPDASISRAFMLFPDPWPKKRHRGRRLFSPDLADRLARILKDGGEFRFASDIADYAQAAIAIADAHPLLETTAIFTSATRDARPDWPATRYERKAILQGRPSTFLSVVRKPRLSLEDT